METIDNALAALTAIIPEPFNNPHAGTPQALLFIGASALIYWFWVRPLLKGNK